MLVRFKVLVLDFDFFEQCFNDFCSMNSFHFNHFKRDRSPKNDNCHYLLTLMLSENSYGFFSFAKHKIFEFL